MTKARQRNGFVLLEVVFATVIVAIGMAALINCLGRCIAAARSVQSYSLAETLLANECCVFRVERPDDLVDQEGQFESYPGIRWTRRLERTDTEGLWEQTITVYWSERGQEASDSVVEYRYLPNKED